MRKTWFILLVIATPLFSFAQDIAGVWVGYIHNDSTNMKLYYEVVISERKGKLVGYSLTNFIVEGKELTGVKTIKISTKENKIYFEDDDLIYNDYPFAPPKGVRQLSGFDKEGEDVLKGKFITSRTKQYGKPVTGTIFLQRVNDFEAARIHPVLKRMNLLAGLSFITPKEDIAKKEEPSPTAVNTPAADVSIKVEKESTSKKDTVERSTNTKASEPVAVNTVKPQHDIKKELEKRKVVTIQTVYFTSDSLLLELYDNGYVDGDSVSIILNGKALMTNVRLTEKAVRKTIHITPDMGDSLNLVMFAENLGSITPNSGIAIIRDGSKQHRISFSGDLERNAAIILRRKK